MTVVLDASAILAFLNEEPGCSKVATAPHGSLVSSVNWAEVVQKSLAHGVDIAGMQTDFSDTGVTFVPFTTTQAELAAGIWSGNPTAGLSLADRACLALALDRQAPVLSADRAWRGLPLGIDVRLLR